MKTILKGKILTVPNALSLLRILLIPLFVWLYLGKKDVYGTVLVLLLSGVSDVLDGWIARHFDMVSDFGKALDPLADKLTQLAMLCCLLIRFPKMLALIILLCVKELFVAATHLAAIRKTEIVMGADWHGKAATCILYGVMTVHLLWPSISETASWALVGAAMLMILLSGILYGIRNIQTAKRGSDKGRTIV